MKDSNIESAFVYLLKDSVNFAEGSIVSKIITKNEGGNVTLFAFDKGQNLSEHTAPFDAMVNIIEGEAIVIIDKKPNHLKEGQFIIMPANVPHAVESVKPFKMMLIMIKN
jgi:quercetin dioxygenase-like cupin family protein